MATQITIANLPPPPAETGSGIVKGTNVIPGTDPLDTSSASTGTTYKYTQSAMLNFYLSAQGLTTYNAVQVATTGALTASYSNGVSGIGATLTNTGTFAALVIDTVTMAIGSRVLVWNQGAQLQNGIYTVTATGTESAAWVMTRATDYNTPAQIVQYGVVLVNQGATYAGRLFEETAVGPFTVGVSTITFAQYETTSLPIPIANSGLLTNASAIPAWVPFTGSGAPVLQVSPTITTPIIGQINDINGNDILQFSAQPSAVNNWLLYNNRSGQPPGLNAIGSDTNIGIRFATKGTGLFQFESEATTTALFYSGAGFAHITAFAFPATAASQVITFPDATGTVALVGGVGSFTWNDVSGTTQTAAVNNGYIISNSSATTVTIPATVSEGSVFAIAGKGAAGWTLQMNTGQTVHYGNSASSSAGSLASTNQWDSVTIVCVTANTTFIVTASQGILTVA